MSRPVDPASASSATFDVHLKIERKPSGSSFILGFWLLLLTGLLALGLVAAVSWAIMSPPAWQLSLTGRSETAVITVTRHTEWDLGSAVICINDRSNSGRPSTNEDSVCGDGSWREIQTSSGTDVRSHLALSGSPANPIRAAIETQNDGRVAMSLRRASGQEGVGQLSSEVTGNAELPSSVNIIWRSNKDKEKARTVVLPFTGEITVGRDVAAGRDKMLIDGQLSIFAASDESLAGRALAEEATLVMGDQLRLHNATDSDGSPASPKGFVRFATAFDDLPFAMDVVAFAPAEGGAIQRFGGGEYRFSAGWWTRIKHKSTLIISIVLISGFLSVLNSLVGVLVAIPTFKDWCRREKE